MITSILSIFFATFVLEDAAIIAAIALVANHQLDLISGFGAAFLGISIGDYILFLIGRFACRVRSISEIPLFVRWRKSFHHKSSRRAMAVAIVVSRAIPGTRLPTYFCAGYLGYPTLSFLTLTVLSVFAWVAFAFAGGEIAQTLFAEHKMLALFSFAGFLLLGRMLIPKLIHPWKRRALVHSWRRWTHFEFWPAWLFYLPILANYARLSVKYGSAYMPMYSNPNVRHGGLVGESKWDLYRHLPDGENRLATYFLGGPNEATQNIKKHLSEGNINFPFILKPDVGQRGYAVRLIQNEDELEKYLANADFLLLAQQYSTLKREAGVFYYRFPDETKGNIFSVTDKEFPFVVGDGSSKLGTLILNDPRARIISSTYFSRFEGALDDIPLEGQRRILSNCGNHCQGAIFLNGNALITEAMAEVFTEIAEHLPDFYVGRFDVRYSDIESFKEGRNFQIVEVNGSGSEATHIWDPKTNLREAYAVLFKQWELVFRIGEMVQKAGKVRHPVILFRLAVDYFKFHMKNTNLKTSS